MSVRDFSALFSHLHKGFQRLVFGSVASVMLGCGAGSTTSTATTAATATSVYPAAYQGAKWGSTVTVAFPTACTMTYTTTGLPNYTPPAYYLGPATGTQTIVATTPIGGLKLAVVPFSPGSVKAAAVTINTCPVKASTTTATNMGVIGYTISGVAMFNSYEATLVPALSDNVTYTFVDSNGVTQTASFLDACSMHPTPATMGYTLHYHGVPACVAAEVDTATGPSHLIGIAYDGFPIYGGRDINGAVINVSQLDACNGITSATPEFPGGAYHYVLPIGVTGSQSSLPCYAGSVPASLVAAGTKKACKMPKMAAAMGM